MKRGYIRVSTKMQKTDRQFYKMFKEHCDIIYTEKISGKNRNRPQLQKMMEELQPGDIVIVLELSRFGRSLMDLLQLVEQIQKMGCEFKSIKEPQLDTTTAEGRLFFAFDAALCQYERELISERTKEGLEATRNKGTILGRPKADKKKLKAAWVLYCTTDYTVNDIAKITGVPRATFYKYKKELRELYGLNPKEN